MKQVQTILASIAAMAIVSFSSCKKDDDTQKSPSATVIEGTKTFDATAYDKWVYFSFKDTTVVNVSDYKTSTAWDIAFHRMDVRVNCGESGPGKGGSLTLGKIDFTSVAEAPESGYSLNASIKIMESYSVPPVYVTTQGDTLLSNKWITYIPSMSGPTYTLSDHIYIVKTADGKYVKLWLKDYFNAEGKGGHITMKYAYQTSGSRSFK